jgi:hypothetical protein
MLCKTQWCQAQQVKSRVHPLYPDKPSHFIHSSSTSVHFTSCKKRYFMALLTIHAASINGMPSNQKNAHRLSIKPLKVIPRRARIDSRIRMTFNWFVY